MIDTFYGASDKTSDSAMAAHAYKRSVEELDSGISRELVRGRLIHYLLSRSHPFYDEHVFPHNKRAHLKME
jgi:hypothetical protein